MKLVRPTIGVGAFAASIWAAWLAYAIGRALPYGDAGNGIFLLLFVALPLALIFGSVLRFVALMSLGRLGWAFAAAAALLLVSQAAWLLRIAPRTASETVVVALVATSVTAAIFGSHVRRRT